MHTEHPRWTRWLAEATGTFAMVFAGCGAIQIDAITGGGLGHLAVCAVFGTIIMTMVYATGPISGAHFNPAVTLGFATTGHFPWREVPGYVGVQLAAAGLAAFALHALLGDIANVGATTVAAGTSIPSAMAIEGILTAFLMFVIMAVATDERFPPGLSGIAIGGAVFVGAVVGGPLTGGSMNPARSLGPALVWGEATSQWLYVIGPILGGQAGAWIHTVLVRNTR